MTTDKQTANEPVTLPRFRLEQLHRKLAKAREQRDKARKENERMRYVIAVMLHRLQGSAHPNVEYIWLLWERMAIEFFPLGDYRAALSAREKEKG
jgi:hypothetical protein